MRKFKVVVVALLALILAVCPALADGEDQLAAIKAKGEIVVATEGAWAPWTYHDEQGNLVGFDVEVAKAIADKLGVTATFAETEWDGIFAGLDAGRYDIAANGVEVTDERAEKYNFTTPYGYIRTALIVRGDNDDITSFEDLAGKHTAVQRKRESLGKRVVERGLGLQKRGERHGGSLGAAGCQAAIMGKAAHCNATILRHALRKTGRFLPNLSYIQERFAIYFPKTGKIGMRS